MSINHPLVATTTQTCFACPEQYEGRLVDSRWFYFRYRHGWASLAVGHDYDAVMGGEDCSVNVGDSLQGEFDSPEQRDQVFAQLLAEVLAR